MVACRARDDSSRTGIGKSRLLAATARPGARAGGGRAGHRRRPRLTWRGLVLVGAGLPEHRIAGLEKTAAAALLDASASELPVAFRSRVLREAAASDIGAGRLEPPRGGRRQPLDLRLAAARARRPHHARGPARLVEAAEPV